MPSLIGNKPSQIPSNGDLGTLAFQDSNAVNISGGTATLSSLTNTGVTTVQAGTVSAPAITTSGDTNTGIYFPAADTIAFTEGGVESMRIDSSGNVGIGSSSPVGRLQLVNSGDTDLRLATSNTGSTATDGLLLRINSTGTEAYLWNYESGALVFGTAATERMRIDSSGNLLVAKTSTSTASVGHTILADGFASHTRSADNVLVINRLVSDGNLIELRQDSTTEGSISVSGTTVSYNGGHLSRYAQTVAPKDESIVKGTILSNLDEMNVYVDADGNTVDNEQLNKVKVSDVEGDVNVAGVFVNWSFDEAHNVDEINMAMTGDMIIRIAQNVVVQKGDLLMSAGNGTAKPQGDDIVRSKTIAKVTSNHVTCTYADGSYCVPCVLMAC